MPAEIVTDQETPAAAALRRLTEELPWLLGIADTVLRDQLEALAGTLAAADARRVAAQCACRQRRDDESSPRRPQAAGTASTGSTGTVWRWRSAVPPKRWTLTCADIATALCGVLRTSGASARCQPVC